MGKPLYESGLGEEVKNFTADDYENLLRALNAARVDREGAERVISAEQIYNLARQVTSNELPPAPQRHALE